MRVLALLLLGATAFGHEFWIEPSVRRPAPGQPFDIALKIGNGFPGETYVPDARHTAAFFRTDGAARVPLAWRASLPRAGSHVLVYRSHRTRILLPPGKFTAYLAEEGLERIVEERRKRGETQTPGREVYSRCAKALVATPGRKLKDRRVGLPLELVMDEPGAATLYFEGKPLAGALVHAFSRKGKPRSARTDEHGRVRFELGPGEWMLSAVHMQRAPKGLDAEWESLWASLTW